MSNHQVPDQRNHIFQKTFLNLLPGSPPCFNRAQPNAARAKRSDVWRRRSGCSGKVLPHLSDLCSVYKATRLLCALAANVTLILPHISLYICCTALKGARRYTHTRHIVQ